MSSSSHDFGKDLLPRLVARGEAVYAHRFPGYWQDVGTLDSYYRANLEFVQPQPPLDLNDPEWVMHTQTADRPPVRVFAGARVSRSLVANGCAVHGEVVNSVLFPGVVVERGAVVRDSIVMHDTLVGAEARLDRAIVDKEVRVGRGARIGDGNDFTPNRACPEHLSSGLVLVGKQAQIHGRGLHRTRSRGRRGGRSGEHALVGSRATPRIEWERRRVERAAAGQNAVDSTRAGASVRPAWTYRIGHNPWPAPPTLQPPR